MKKKDCTKCICYNRTPELTTEMVCQLCVDGDEFEKETNMIKVIGNKIDRYRRSRD